MEPMIAHDREGFLVGERPTDGKIVAVLAAIKKDTGAIVRQVVGHQARRSSPRPRASTEVPPHDKAAAVVTPARRESVARSASPADRMAAKATATAVASAVKTALAPVGAKIGVPLRRDAAGRFLSRSDSVSRTESGQGRDEKPVQNQHPDEANGRSSLVRNPLGQTIGTDTESLRSVAKELGRIEQAANEIKSALAPVGAKVEVPLRRDVSGRFLSRSMPGVRPGGAKERGVEPGQDPQPDEADRPTSRGRNYLGRTLEAAGDSMRRVADGLERVEQVDPALQAANEIKSALAPVGAAVSGTVRGIGRLAGMGKRNDEKTLLRRMLDTLRGIRKDNSLKPGAQAASVGVLSSMLGSLPTFGVGAMAARFLPKSLTKFMGIGSEAGAVGAEAGAAAGAVSKVGMLGKAGSFLAKAGKRLPFLGALFAAGDVAAGELDDSKSRAEKDRHTGGAIGGFAASLAGAAGGAKLGAAIGTAIAPGVGTVVGGLIGGVGGGVLGDKFGQVVGEKFGELVTYLRNANLVDVIAKAIGSSFDWAKKAVEPVVETVKEAATTAKETMVNLVDSTKQKYSDARDYATTAAKDFKAGASGELTNDPAKLNSRAFQAGAAVAPVLEAGSNVVDSVGGAVSNTVLGRGVKVAAEWAKGRSRAQRNAIETGSNWTQGNIAGLSDAQTRALVASTAETESGGGNLAARNAQGYSGRYQAGASWLANAGLIKGGSGAVNAAMKADGFRSEWEWAKAGGMSKFLKNDANWSKGRSLDQYLASADMQDAAFKTNNDLLVKQMRAKGIIKPGDSEEHIAGLLKSAHLSGIGGASAVAGGRDGPKDANGTSARKYFNDLRYDPAQYAAAFATATPVVPPTPPIPSPPEAPKVNSMVQLNTPQPPVVNVSVSQPLPGQNVPDRQIAHIASGGMGASGPGY